MVLEQSLPAVMRIEPMLIIPLFLVVSLIVFQEHMVQLLEARLIKFKETGLLLAGALRIEHKQVGQQ